MLAWASRVAIVIKNSPAMQETWVQSLGQESPLEEGMATHSSILAWRIPRTGEPSGLQFIGSHRVRHDLAHTQSNKISQEQSPCIYAHSPQRTHCPGHVLTSSPQIALFGF